MAKPKPTVPMVRLTATVDEATANEIRELAKGLDVSVTRLLGTLLTIAVQTGGATFQAFADDVARLKGQAEA